MGHQLFTVLLLLLPAFAAAQSLPDVVSRAELTIGQTLEIESRRLGEHRRLNVYLPTSYADDSLRSYPVIYLLDGSLDEDFLHVAGIVQFGSFPWVNLVPESIVVGIANVDRKRDFTHPSDNELDRAEFPTAGHSEAFIAFLGEELQPFIAATYRTADSRTLIGQSLGGLLATEILFARPDLFDHYVIVSPSLWWDDESLLSAEPAAYSSPKSIYIAGGKEGEVMERTARALHAKLGAAVQPGTRLFYEFLEDKTHGDALHVAVYQAFGKLFGVGEAGG